MRRRLRRGSVLGDLRAGGRFGAQAPWVPAQPPPSSGVGVITPPMILPGAISGVAMHPGAFDITHFASNIRPVAIVSSLPPLPDPNYPEGAPVILTTDGKLYRNVGGTWVRNIAGADIDADSITAGQIAAGAVGASEIAAGAITTEKLTVGVLHDSVTPNAGFEEVALADATLPAGWTREVGGGTVALSGSVRRSGLRSVGVTASATTWAALRADTPTFFIPVAPADSWYASVWAQSDVAITDGGFLEIAFYDTAGTYVGSQYAKADFAVGTTWAKYEGLVTVPANVNFASVWLYNFQPNVTSTIYYDDLTFQKAVGSAMIIDAAIQNAKIANLSVTNLKIADQTIEAIKYKQVRNVIQIPFDDSLDSIRPLECFFQMPSGVVTIKSAKVWVHQKSFRAYSTAAASGGGGTSGGGGGTTTSSGEAGNHNHQINYSFVATDGGNGGTTDSQGQHDHDQVGEAFTGQHSHNLGSHSHNYNLTQSFTGSGSTHTHNVTLTDHTHSVGSHSHGLTFAIHEQAATGNFSVDVSNDGTTASYVNVVTSQVPPINGASIAANLTITPGDRRIRINTTGLNRAQVLLVLDLILELGA